MRSAVRILLGVLVCVQVAGCRLAGSSESSGSPLAISYVGSGLWSEWSDLVVDDDVAAVVTSHGLLTIDVSQPQSPQIVGELPLVGKTPRRIVIDRGLAYIAAGQHGLLVVDLADPHQPTLLASLEVQGYVFVDIAKSGSLVFAASWNSGLVIVDVSSPRQPHLLSTVPLDSSLSVGASGDLACIATPTEMLIVDASNPTSPKPVGRLTERFSSPWQIRFKQDTIYIACYMYGLFVIDNADPSHPALLNHIWDPCTDGGLTMNVALQDSLAFATSTTWGLKVFDLSNPREYRIVGTWPGAYAPLTAMALQRDHCFVLGPGPALNVLDVSDSQSPQLVGTLTHPAGLAGVAMLGDFAYIVESSWPPGEGKLFIVDVSDPRKPVLVGSRAGVRHMAFRDHFGFFAAGAKGVEIVDVSDPSLPNTVGEIPTDSGAVYVALDGNLLYIADTARGIRIVNVEHPGRPREVGSFRHELYPGALQVIASGKQAFVLAEAAPPRLPPGALQSTWGARSKVIIALDVSDPANAAVKSVYSAGPRVRSMAVFRNLVYVANERTGVIRVVDFGNPSAPVQIDSIETKDPASNVLSVVDGRLFVAGSGGLSVLDLIHQPHPTKIGSFDTPSPVFQVAVADRLVYVADRTGFLVLRLESTRPISR